MTRVIFGVLVLCMLRAVGDVPAAAATLGDCRQNLSRLHGALQEYRRAHQTLPKTLSDLPPPLPEAKHPFHCPDASQSVPYVYEFESVAVTNGLGRDLGVTLRRWRELQMGRLGSAVPLLRCTNHLPVLNLSFDGGVFESGPTWEQHFADRVPAESLALEALLAEHYHLQVVRIPAREPGMSPECIDLTAHYNGSLQGWLEWNPAASLAALPVGRVMLAGVTFDIRGVIQLGSAQFNMLHRPAAVSNILLELRAPNLVFLHGTISEEIPSTVIGRYVLHFEDGSRESVDLAYGRHLAHWRASGAAPGRLTNTARFWTGTQQDEKGATRDVHLYGTRWVNPRPELRIRSLDFVSLQKQSSPFLVAVTAEGGAVTSPSPHPDRTKETEQ